VFTSGAIACGDALSLAGTAGLFVAARLTPSGPLSLRDNVLSRYALESNLEVLILPYLRQGPSPAAMLYLWLGRQDSNLRIRGSKPRALPLGDVPIKTGMV
jgi:hypothetical protein